MVRARSLSAAAFVLALGAAQPALAAGPFECPTRTVLDAGRAADVKALFAGGDPLDNVERMNAAVTTLKGQGVSPVVIVDNLIAAYCQSVSGQSGLTDAQKASRVTRFAGRITHIVYSLDSADEIILDVSFPPAVVDAINAKAKAAGVSPESWIQTTVNAGLK